MTTDRPSTATRTLRRRANDRVIGGVAGGLGDYFNIDPLLLRVGFVGLMLFGGAGLVLYVIAWLLIPVAGRDASIAEQVVSHLPPLHANRLAVVLLVAAVAFLLFVMSPRAFPVGPGIYIDDRALIALAVIVAGVVLLRRSDGPPATAEPAAAEAGAAEPAAAAAVAEGPTPAAGPVAAPVAAPAVDEHRLPSPLGWYTLAAALAAVALLAVVDLLPATEVELGQYLAAVLTLIGIGLVVGAWWGRAQLLILLGLLLVPVAVVAAFVTAPLEGGIGQHTFAPRSVGELRDEYRLIGGELELDLAAVDAGSEPIELAASVAVGRLVVVLPDGADFAVDARVGGGDLSLIGNHQAGTDLADAVRTGGRPAFVLDLEAGIGQVAVHTASDSGG